jgi:TPR repeat protein
MQESHGSGSAPGEASAFGFARERRQAVALFAPSRTGMMHDAEALDCFGQIFRFTLGVNSDLGKAAELPNKVADAVHVRAMCHYGDLIEEGGGVPQVVLKHIY